MWRTVLDLLRRETEVREKKRFNDNEGLNFILKDELIYYTREDKVRLYLLKNFEKRVF
jgi:hypothetical protein